jgi:NAD(P)-dependent dehydrogenase (short-subunit alcohol dehydrogenase family)
MHAYYLIYIFTMQRNKSDMNYTDKMLRDDALKGKVIVVTGGGSGLGRAMTQYFLELGAKVAITPGLRKLKYRIRTGKKTGGTCLPIQCDVRHYEEVEHVAKRIESFCKVDVLLNNAAGNFILLRNGYQQMHCY